MTRHCLQEKVRSYKKDRLECILLTYRIASVCDFRARCSVIREYPLYRLCLQSDLVHMFSEGSPCHVRRYNIYHFDTY